MRTLLFLIAILVATNMLAQPGTLDHTFSGDGKLTTAMTAANSVARTILVQPDAKILAAGGVNDAGISQFAITRYHADGTTDLTFNTTGKAFLNFNNHNSFCTGSVLQPDGKIILAGFTESTGGHDFALARLNSNGTTDVTFGDNGKVTASPGITSFCDAVALQPDGKILAAGHTLEPFTLSNVFVVYRFNPDGALDTTFGNNGKVLTAIGNDSAIANCMALQPDGKIILAGQRINMDTFRWELALVRYLPDGTPDDNFGSGGKVIAVTPGLDGNIKSITLQPDKKIIVAGHAGTSPSNNQLLLARFLDNGSPDLDFATNGMLITLASLSNNMLQAVAVQREKIIVGGSVRQGSNDRFLLACYNFDGSPDAAFGNDGSTVTAFGMHDGAYAMALQPDGKILAAGVTYIENVAQFALARYHGTANLGTAEMMQTKYALAVYPNPLQDISQLRFTLENPETVSAELHDALGKKIRNLIHTETKSAGIHEISLAFTAALPSGMYHIVFSTAHGNATLKLLK